MTSEYCVCGKRKVYINNGDDACPHCGEEYEEGEIDKRRQAYRGSTLNREQEVAGEKHRVACDWREGKWQRESAVKDRAINRLLTERREIKEKRVKAIEEVDDATS